MEKLNLNQEQEKTMKIYLRTYIEKHTIGNNKEKREEIYNENLTDLKKKYKLA